MKTKDRSLPVGLIVTSSILLVLIIFIIGVQGSLGRYMTSITGNVSFAPEAKLSGALTADGDNMTLNVTGVSGGQTFTVRLYYVGDSPPNRLTIGGIEAECKDKAYRFFNPDGTEHAFVGESLTIATDQTTSYKIDDFTVRVKPINED